jgi:N-acetylneuraminic acid mutarotase
MSKGFVLLIIFCFLTLTCVFVIKPVSAISGKDDTWVTKAPLPQVIALPSAAGGRAAVVAGKIYVVGGSASYEYDPAANTWSAKTPMPTPRFYFGIASYQNKIYTIGGFNFVNGTPTRYSVNEIYDTATDTWQTKQPMPTSRYDLTAETVNGEIYLIGGTFGDTNNPPIKSTLSMNEVYDIANDSWTTKESSPYPARSYASSVSDGKIYIISQYFTQIYYPGNDTWSQGTSMPTPVSNAAAVATIGVQAQKLIYVFGGASAIDKTLVGTDLTQVYNPENNSWTYGAPMPTAREWLTAAAVDDTVYVIGGSVGLSLPALTNNEVYTPFGYGTVPPVISLISPENTNYSFTNISLSFSVNKAVNWIGYSFDGQQNVTILGNCTIDNITNGLHIVKVYANDTFGNIGASETRNFSVAALPLAKPESSPTLPLVAVSVLIVVAVVAGLLVFCRRNRQIKHCEFK